ncbi:shadow of prion protein [Pteropus vampyrus]|uniref:Shadow of prion protein n=1 Tax=Pteropus vampyrus TaxID=132908 RepID=A0A6P6D223_PTEVA|nr:shadow of prion protein [Pteropus vampyrus]
MNWTVAMCWALLLATAFLCDGSEAKGGRGGARGSARGGLSSRRALGPWERGLEDEDGAPGSNGTGQGLYSYRAWTSAAGPSGSLRLCLLLGVALGALGLLPP